MALSKHLSVIEIIPARDYESLFSYLKAITGIL
jgi:hypothetical protein